MLTCIFLAILHELVVNSTFYTPSIFIHHSFVFECFALSYIKQTPRVPFEGFSMPTVSTSPKDRKCFLFPDFLFPAQREECFRCFDSQQK